MAEAKDMCWIPRNFRIPAKSLKQYFFSFIMAVYPKKQRHKGKADSTNRSVLNENTELY